MDEVRIDRKEFWENKLLTWEQGRYRPGSLRQGMLERLANRASASLRFRLKSAGELLAPVCAGKRVLDLGCGSGLLAEALVEAGVGSYHGVDIAERAVDAAKVRAAEHGWDHCTFEVGSIASIADQEADIVVSLGLLDWLTDAELKRVFTVAPEADFLHAIAEKQPSPTQWIHRAYCWVAYGYRTKGYVPRYYSTQHIASDARSAHERPVHAWRHPELTFGAYVNSLGLGDEVR